MKRSLSKVKEMIKLQIQFLSDGTKEFKIDDNLTVYADALEEDMIVFDVDSNPLANAEFTLEGKVYKTGENGEIISIEEVPADAEAEKEVDAADEAPADAPAEDDASQKRIEELEVENQGLKAELATLNEELAKLKDEAIQLASQASTKGINLSDVSTNEVEKPKSALEVIKDALSK